MPGKVLYHKKVLRAFFESPLLALSLLGLALQGLGLALPRRWPLRRLWALGAGALLMCHCALAAWDATLFVGQVAFFAILYADARSA